MKARILSNLNWLLADKVVRLVGGLFIGVWIARYLGPERFGLLNYALAFVALFGTVAKLGMDQLVVRDLTREPEREGEILGTVFVLKLVSAVLGVALVIPAAWLTQQGDISFIILVAVIAAGMMFNPFDVYDIYYQSHVLSRHVVLSRGAAFLLITAMRVGLILGEYPVVYFAAASTMEIALGSAFVAWAYMRNRRKTGKWLFAWIATAKLLKSGWPLIIGSALVIIHTRIDQVMIGAMLSNVDVGIYGAAVRLSDVWLFVPALIVQTLMPYFSTIRESNADLYRARLIQLYSIMFWLGALVGVFTIAFGGYFVVLIFGEPYRDAYLPLTLTVWTGIFISQALARGIWTIGEDMQGYRLASNLIAVPVNILLNWTLIPNYGIIGASSASFVSIGFGTWVVPFLFKSMRESNRQMLLAINPKYLLRSAT